MRFYAKTTGETFFFDFFRTIFHLTASVAVFRARECVQKPEKKLFCLTFRTGAETSCAVHEPMKT